MKVKEESENAGLKLNIQKMMTITSSSMTSWQVEGEKSRRSGRFYFLGLHNHCGWWLQPWNWKMLAPWKNSHDKPRQCIKKQRYRFTDKGPYSQSYGFSSSIWMASWTIKKAESQRIDAFELWCWRRLESPLDCKEIKPVYPKGNQCWIFIGRIDAEAEAPVLWPPYVKSRLTGKTPTAGKDWGREEKGVKRRWDGWMASLTQWTWVWANSGRYWRTGKLGVLHAVHGVAERMWLSDWTTTEN